MKAPIKATLIWLLITLLIYSILFKWLDIDVMYTVYRAYENSSWLGFTRILKIIFAPELWALIGLAFLIFGYHQRKKIRSKTAAYQFTLGSSLSLAAIIATLIKFTLARYRPIELIDFNLYGFHYFSLKSDLNSTPSGHAVMSFALFFTLARFIRKTWVTLLCLIPPLIISLSRLILAEHYLSDLVLGAYIGITSVLWAEWMLQHFFAFITPRIGNKSNAPDLFE